MGAYQQGQLGSTPMGAQMALTQPIGLPRDPAAFTSGAFGPLSPITPIGIDVPDPSSGRPDPRRWQYPVGWDMPVGIPGSEGLKLASFAQLRSLADNYSVARACINLRQNEILGLDWDIGPTETAEKKMRGSETQYDDFNDRRAKAIAFFRRPDVNYHDFQSWLRAVLEEIFVLDATAIFMQPTRAKGKGLLGSDVGNLSVLDGSTIRPLVDMSGATPRPPNPAYQQYLWGVPRVDLMDIILESDMEGIGDAEVRSYRGDQLLYLRYCGRTWTPYGFPPVEQAVVPILAGLAKQQYTMQWFQEGSVPNLFLTPGPDISTPAQIAALQSALNSLAGDIGFKHKIVVLPPGSQTHPQKPTALADEFDQLVMEWVMMAFEVQPMELGIIMGRGGKSGGGSSTASGTGTGAASIQKSTADRKALKPLLMWLKRSIFDFILRDVCGQDDMEWKWRGVDDNPMDPEAHANQLQTLSSFGALSIDEVRDELGRSPWGLPMTSDPVFIGQAGPIPFGQIAPLEEQEAEGLDDPIANPFEQADAPETPPQPPTGDKPAKDPNASTPSKGTPPKDTPAPGAPDESPAHATATIEDAGDRPSVKSAAPVWSPRAQRSLDNELELLKRVVRKGRPIDSFTPDHIPDPLWKSILAKAAATGDPNAAVAYGQQSAQGWAHVQNREATIALQTAAITIPMGVWMRKMLRGKIDRHKFVSKVTDAIGAAMYATAAAGASAAVTHANVTSDDIPDDQPDLDDITNQVATSRSAAQAPYVANWADKIAKDIAAGVAIAAISKAVSNRIDLYGRSLQAAYEHAHSETVHAIHATAPPSDTDTAAIPATKKVFITWHTMEDGVVCGPCSDRDGQVFTKASLPGYPGEGSFGGSLCEGGPRCRCWLSYSFDRSPSGMSDMGAASAATSGTSTDAPASTPSFSVSAPDMATASKTLWTTAPLAP